MRCIKSPFLGQDFSLILLRVSFLWLIDSFLHPSPRMKIHTDSVPCQPRSFIDLDVDNTYFKNLRHSYFHFIIQTQLLSSFSDHSCRPHLEHGMLWHISLDLQPIHPPPNHTEFELLSAPFHSDFPCTPFPLGRSDHPKDSLRNVQKVDRSNGESYASVENSVTMINNMKI